MARYGVVIRRYQVGSFRVVYEANKEWLELFSKRERNAMLRGTAKRLGNEWRFKFLKRRLERSSVLKPPFNYDLDTRSPMYHSGNMAKAAIWKGKIKATAKTSKSGDQQIKVDIPLPYGHPVRPEIAVVFRIIPPDEVQWFADRFSDLLVNERKRADNATKARKNAKPRLRLSSTQRKRFGVTSRRRSK